MRPQWTSYGASWQIRGLACAAASLAAEQEQEKDKDQEREGS